MLALEVVEAEVQLERSAVLREVEEFGEHGVGIEKINHMCVQFRTPELEMFHAVKHALDEHGLLNPGKAVPSLNRCAEFGRMHVHVGQEKHSELPRF